MIIGFISVIASFKACFKCRATAACQVGLIQ